jgi:hypothetical protein
MVVAAVMAVAAAAAAAATSGWEITHGTADESPNKNINDSISLESNYSRKGGNATQLPQPIRAGFRVCALRTNGPATGIPWSEKGSIN